jgi:hypothetical protein
MGKSRVIRAPDGLVLREGDILGEGLAVGLDDGSSRAGLDGDFGTDEANAAEREDNGQW